MAFTDHELNTIYDRTSGYCHICKKKLAWRNYGVAEARAAWEVEHSLPKARGGTDHMNNLYAACIPCNRSKGDGSTAAARGSHGRRRAPLSRTKRLQARRANAVKGALIGAAIGSLGGPGTALVGGLVGAEAGYDRDPDSE